MSQTNLLCPQCKVKALYFCEWNRRCYFAESSLAHCNQQAMWFWLKICSDEKGKRNTQEITVCWKEFEGQGKERSFRNWKLVAWVRNTCIQFRKIPVAHLIDRLCNFGLLCFFNIFFLMIASVSGLGKLEHVVLWFYPSFSWQSLHVPSLSRKEKESNLSLDIKLHITCILHKKTVLIEPDKAIGSCSYSNRDCQSKHKSNHALLTQLLKSTSS